MASSFGSGDRLVGIYVLAHAWTGENIRDLVDLRGRRHEFDFVAQPRLGWTVLTLWECEIHDVFSLALRLRRFLGATVQARRPGARRPAPTPRET